MPLIGWFFTILAIVLIVGGLFILRDNASWMPLDKDKLKKIRKRKEEVEKEEKDDW
jgi:hypothetical protein